MTRRPPFQYLGLDYFGPVYVRATEPPPRKSWVCLFVCSSTRAVHLELVNDMTTDEFIMCFWRFVARRGVPTDVLSDNAKHFHSASTILDRFWLQNITSDDVQQFAAQNGITWHFTPERAPWFGGMYERLVGTVKRALCKSMGRLLLSPVQISTLLTEIEAIVNS